MRSSRSFKNLWSQTDFTKCFFLNHKEQQDKALQSFNRSSSDLGSGNYTLHLSFSFLSLGIFVLCDLVVVQLINHISISLFLYLPPSFRLSFLTSRWPPGPAGCWRREFSCLWWSSSPTDHGCPWSVRSELAGIEGKRSLMSKPQTYSARERVKMWQILYVKKLHIKVRKRESTQYKIRLPCCCRFPVWKTFAAKKFSSISKSWCFI